MINNISEGALRTSVKPEPGGTIHDRQVAQQKTEEIRQARPIEDSEAGAKAGSNKREEEGSSKYLFDKNTLVYEKYNKDGDLIYRVPPSTTPVDERA